MHAALSVGTAEQFDFVAAETGKESRSDMQPVLSGIPPITTGSLGSAFTVAFGD